MSALPIGDWSDIMCLSAFASTNRRLCTQALVILDVVKLYLGADVYGIVGKLVLADDLNILEHSLDARRPLPAPREPHRTRCSPRGLRALSQP